MNQPSPIYGSSMSNLLPPKFSYFFLCVHPSQISGGHLKETNIHNQYQFCKLKSETWCSHVQDFLYPCVWASYLCETSLFEMEIKISHVLEHAAFLKFNVKN